MLAPRHPRIGSSTKGELEQALYDSKHSYYLLEAVFDPYNNTRNCRLLLVYNFFFFFLALIVGLNQDLLHRIRS